MDDSKIIELFFARSDRAVAELDGRYGGVCHHTARNILSNREDAEECVNDAYLGVWNTIPPKKPDSLAAFVLRLVRNISIDRLRHNLAQKRMGNYQECLEEWSCSLSCSDTPESVYEGKLLAGYINDFLCDLSRTNQLLFIRRYWYLDSISTLALTTGMRPAAVRTRLSRLRSQLKEELERRGVVI